MRRSIQRIPPVEAMVAGCSRSSQLAWRKDAVTEGAKFPDTCGGWVASLIPIFILQPPFEEKDKRQFGYSRDKRPGYCVSGHLTDPHP